MIGVKPSLGVDAGYKSFVIQVTKDPGALEIL